MNFEQQVTPLSADANDSAAFLRPTTPRLVTFGLILVAATIVAGSPELGAPWIPGDEFIFIVDNPDVNPAAAVGAAQPGLLKRALGIFAKIHDDLYQPVPILTYAVEWELSNGSALSFRATDLLLHALNAVLLWWVLYSLLRRLDASRPAPALVVTWSLALLWALHPVQTNVYAADMGRTHLLSATFALIALGLHVRALTSGREAWFLGSLAALLLAMMSKVLPGWVLITLALEIIFRGPKAALTSYRVYVVGAICAFFAALAMYTSARSGLAEEAAKGLFGDPVSRSALAIWIYFRDLLAPFWLTVWHLPDPDTKWSNPRVWLGLFLAAASVAHAIRAWQRGGDSRMITLGWVWFWALLLPVVGLVGAREAAAVDRYLYQPLMGITLVIGVAVTRVLARFRSLATRAPNFVIPIAAALGLVMLVIGLPYCAAARSVIRRATRFVQLNPHDPRALEGLAAAYDFARTHPIAAEDLKQVPPDVDRSDYFRTLWVRTLMAAASTENLATYFPRPEDLGPFHRRLAYKFYTANLWKECLWQAEMARRLLPNEFATWKLLAVAHRGLREYEEAAAAYRRCEELLPDNPVTQVVLYTEFGKLLMFDMQEYLEACRRFDRGRRIQPPPDLGDHPDDARVWLQTQQGLAIGMAACLIEYGSGEDGYRLIMSVLRQDPDNLTARLVLARYHHKSEHWDRAAAVYMDILRRDPTDYDALRGFHNVCMNTGNSVAALVAWTRALQELAEHPPEDAIRDPRPRAFESFSVWALALAGQPQASDAADALLKKDSCNPFACFAKMLVAARAEQWNAAVAWARLSRYGDPIPAADAYERAVKTLRVLIREGQLPAEAAIVQAEVVAVGEFPPAQLQAAIEMLDDLMLTPTSEPWLVLAHDVRRELSDLLMQR